MTEVEKDEWLSQMMGGERLRRSSTKESFVITEELSVLTMEAVTWIHTHEKRDLHTCCPRAKLPVLLLFGNCVRHNHWGEPDKGYLGRTLVWIYNYFKIKFLKRGLPWWSSGYESTLPQGTWIWQLDPTCCNGRFCMPQLRPSAAK